MFFCYRVRQSSSKWNLYSRRAVSCCYSNRVSYVNAVRVGDKNKFIRFPCEWKLGSCVFSLSACWYSICECCDDLGWCPWSHCNIKTFEWNSCYIIGLRWEETTIKRNLVILNTRCSNLRWSIKLLLVLASCCICINAFNFCSSNTKFQNIIRINRQSVSQTCERSSSDYDLDTHILLLGFIIEINCFALLNDSWSCYCNQRSSHAFANIWWHPSELRYKSDRLQRIKTVG